VAKAELGTKRICPNCGAKYYDLNRVPIVCPRCGTNFDGTVSKARPQAAAKPAVVDDDEVEVESVPEVELVSLEEADVEAAADGVVKIAGEEDEEVVEADEEEDDTFLEEEDEEGDDVNDIIGGVEDEEP